MSKFLTVNRINLNRASRFAFIVPGMVYVGEHLHSKLQLGRVLNLRFFKTLHDNITSNRLFIFTCHCHPRAGGDDIMCSELDLKLRTCPMACAAVMVSRVHFCQQHSLNQQRKPDRFFVLKWLHYLV